MILEYTFADNDVWIHIPPSDKRWGAAFSQLVGPGGPVKANPGLMRDMVGDQFDVVGIGGNSGSAPFIKKSIDAVTVPDEIVPLEGKTNKATIRLILLAH